MRGAAALSAAAAAAEADTPPPAAPEDSRGTADALRDGGLLTLLESTMRQKYLLRWISFKPVSARNTVSNLVVQKSVLFVRILWSYRAAANKSHSARLISTEGLAPFPLVGLQR